MIPVGLHMTEPTHRPLAFSRRRTHRIGLLVLAALPLLAYLPVGTFDFVFFDDKEYVSANIWVQQGITPETVKWAFSTFYVANWHPLTWLSHMLDVTLFGLSPGLMHMVNLLIHVANIFLLFVFLQKSTHDFWKSFLVALLFGLHPLHVESVAWISERKDLLCAFFYLTALLAYGAYARKPGVVRYICVLAAFGAGLLAKPMIVTFPFLLLLLDLWPLKRLAIGKSGPVFHPDHPFAFSKNLILEKLPFFLMTALFCLVTIQAQKSGGAVGSFQVYPLLERLGNALSAYLGYVEKTVWPACLCFFYPHHGMPGLARIVGCLVFFSGTFIAAVELAKKHPYVAVGWFWYLGTLVPVIGLVQVGGQAMADRYTYIPQVGLFIAGVWGLGAWAETGRRKKAAVVCAAAVAGACFFVTAFQVRHWQNSETLFQQALACTANNFVAHNNYGAYLANEGRLKQARDQMNQALAIKSDHAGVHINLGVVASKLGQFHQAAQHYQQALKINPHEPTALKNLGNTYEKLGNLQKAALYYRKAIAEDPKDAAAQYNLGVALTGLGKSVQAENAYRAALKNNPFHTGALNNLAGLLVNRGMLKPACRLFQTALKIDPELTMARDNLAKLEKALKKKQEQGHALAKALEKHPDDPGVHIQMGQVYKSEGNWEKALEHFEKAVKLDPDRPEGVHTLAVALAMRGRYDPALSALAGLENRGMATPRTHYLMAAVYSRKKDAKQALGWLEKAVANGFDPGTHLEDDPNFDAIRHLPAFLDLAKRLQTKMDETAKPPGNKGGP